MVPSNYERMNAFLRSSYLDIIHKLSGYSNFNQDAFDLDCEAEVHCFKKVSFKQITKRRELCKN